VGADAGRRATLAVLAFAALAVTALAWAKWLPYAERLGTLSPGRYPGSPIFDQTGGTPSASGAWDFTKTYFVAVWKALVAALLLSAALAALFPPRSVARALSGRGLAGAARGGLLALPGMMCTCCSAPLAVTLRREGAPAASVLAFWLANPLLNPAVIAFLALVLPWEYALTRVVIGVAVIALVAAWASGRDDVAPAPAGRSPAVRLVPAYVVVVFGVGLLAPWLFPFGHDLAGHPALAVLAAAGLGTLVVIPTGAEIPILLGLSAAGFGSGVLGALLITLPAVSVPSLLMVRRAFGPSVVVAVVAAVAAAGLAGGVLLTVLA
jgi:uncharacterized membrane protein YraQ (UPF0718 family)